MVGWHHRLNGHSLSKLQEMVKDREAWRAAVHGITSWTWLSDWTTTSITSLLCALYHDEELNLTKYFPGGSEDKESACKVGDLGSIPGLGRSPGEESGNPLQYSCLENPMDRGAWRSAIHGVTKSRTQLLKNIASIFQTASTCIFSCVSYTNSGFVFILTIIILQRKKMWPNDLKYLPRERQLANGSM